MKYMNLVLTCFHFDLLEFARWKSLAIRSVMAEIEARSDCDSDIEITKFKVVSVSVKIDSRYTSLSIFQMNQSFLKVEFK